MYMATMTVSEARAVLPEILDRISDGEEITLTRHGRPVAVIVRPDTLRARRAGSAAAVNIRDLLEDGRRAPLPSPSLSQADADTLVAGVRRSRAGR